MTWTKRDAIYFAGIIDGEGTIQIEIGKVNERRRAHSWCYTSRLSVVNTSKDLMDWIVPRFGGKYHMRRRDPDKKKDTYSWSTCAENMENVLIAIEPHLIIKRKHCALVLAYRKTFQKGHERITDEVRQFRVDCYNAMRSLNHTGPIKPLPLVTIGQ